MEIFYLNELPNKEAEYRQKLKVAQNLLEGLLLQQQQCLHVWGNPVSVKAFGNMNPAHCGESISRRIKDYPHSHWSRVCEKCGLLQHANTTKEIAKVVPDFGDY